MKSEPEIRILRDSSRTRMLKMSGHPAGHLCANIIEGVLSWVLEEKSEGDEILEEIISKAIREN